MILYFSDISGRSPSGRAIRPSLTLIAARYAFGNFGATIPSGLPRLKPSFRRDSPKNLSHRFFRLRRPAPYLAQQLYRLAQLFELAIFNSGFPELCERDVFYLTDYA